MARLRSKVTGVVVEASDDTAGRLGSEYEPVTEKSAPKKATGSKSTK